MRYEAFAINIFGNASFGNASLLGTDPYWVKRHVAFARNPGSLQSIDGNGKSAKIELNSISNNVTTVILFAVLCVAVNVSMSFCRCLCSRLFLPSLSRKDEILTQKGQGQSNDLPRDRKREAVLTIDDLYDLYPTSDYSTVLPRLHKSSYCQHFIGHTPRQIAELETSCSYPTTYIQDSIPLNRSRIERSRYHANTPERLI